MLTAQWRQGSHYVVHDADAMAQPRAELFDPAYWQEQNRVEGRALGRGSLVFVRGGARGQTWALRHYRRGGWAARVIRDSYLWMGLRAARPWREFHLTGELHDKGLPVPRPVGAHIERRGPLYRGDLITERIVGAEPLADLLASGPMPPLQWIVLGKVLRRFHDAGVRHDDINARNVLRDARGSFYLIDFDKADLLPSGPWQAQNLARFQRSLQKFKTADPRLHYEALDWQALLSGYG
ncbi:MAG: 3-deoxy-D-manno-octulosonic acid kinase [Arenimonas sp.]